MATEQAHRCATPAPPEDVSDVDRRKIAGAFEKLKDGQTSGLHVRLPVHADRRRHRVSLVRRRRQEQLALGFLAAACYKLGYNVAADVKSYDVVITEIAMDARYAYRSGARPSTLIRTIATQLAERGFQRNMIHFMMIGRAAFGLSIAECKHVGIWWRGDPDHLPEKEIDDYLIPLIERSRGIWDQR